MSMLTIVLGKKSGIIKLETTTGYIYESVHVFVCFLDYNFNIYCIIVAMNKPIKRSPMLFFRNFSCCSILFYGTCICDMI